LTPSPTGSFYSDSIRRWDGGAIMTYVLACAASPVGEYVIIYRVEGADALILHVMRGSRDIEGFLSE
jgi:plasmid stabilization system protein ParE